MTSNIIALKKKTVTGSFQEGCRTKLRPFALRLTSMSATLSCQGYEVLKHIAGILVWKKSVKSWNCMDGLQISGFVMFGMVCRMYMVETWRLHT
jgi:hypothetical protein